MRIPTASRVPGRLFRLIVPILLVCAVLAICFRFAQVVWDHLRTEIENFPESAVDWLLENKPKGNLFNLYGWGDYLNWRMYPEYRVYTDGRADVDGNEFIFVYKTIYRAEQGWQDMLNGQAVQTFLVESYSPLSNMQRQSMTWRIIFEDKASTIILR